MNTFDRSPDQGLHPTSDEMRQRRAAFDALKRDVMEGIEEAERGEVAELDVEAIIAAGRRELARREKVETLRRDLMIGIEEIERGEVSNATANDIIAKGRRILAQRRRET
jgi:hypothetical protein